MKDIIKKETGRDFYHGKATFYRGHDTITATVTVLTMTDDDATVRSGEYNVGDVHFMVDGPIDLPAGTTFSVNGAEFEVRETMDDDDSRYYLAKRFR